MAQPAAELTSMSDFVTAGYQLAAFDFISDAFGIEVEWPLSLAFVEDEEDEREHDEW